MNLLLVDDNPDTADMVKMLFSLRGHVVETAHDPLTALVKARDFDADVMILDIGLPHMDGYELAEHLRVNGATCRMVVVSGAQPDQRRCARLGISSYLVKPAPLDALVAAVEQNAPPQAGPAPFMAMSAAA